MLQLHRHWNTLFVCYLPEIVEDRISSLGLSSKSDQRCCNYIVIGLIYLFVTYRRLSKIAFSLVAYLRKVTRDAAIRLPLKETATHL